MRTSQRNLMDVERKTLNSGLTNRNRTQTVPWITAYFCRRYEHAFLPELAHLFLIIISLNCDSKTVRNKESYRESLKMAC